MITNERCEAEGAAPQRRPGPRERFVAELRAEWGVASRRLFEAECAFDAVRAAPDAAQAAVQEAGGRVIEARAECHTIRLALEAADRWYWESTTI
jgi:hypothetical protein